MNFDWTEADLEYRDAVRGFLRQYLGPHWHGYEKGDAEVYKRQSKAFCAAMAERGWLTQNWPKEYGGREASAWHALILSEELWPRHEPRGSQYMNVNWIGPAIMQFGTPEQKAFFLPKISGGSITWAQGFSEPNAGSDLASLQTRAVRQGDHYIVNGEKIWTSHADIAEWMFLLVRTDPTSRKSAGITVLLVPIDTPGMDIRKVPGVVGEGAFSNPVFTDMKVPVSARLGEENRGWDVVRWALAFERVGAAHHKAAEVMLNDIAKEAHLRGRMDDPQIQAKFGEAWAALEAARLLFYKVVDLRAHGSPPTPDSNISRVAGAVAQRALMDLALEIFGAEAMEPGSPGDARVSLLISVGAGTTEIQLDQIATNHLKMPRA